MLAHDFALDAADVIEAVPEIAGFVLHPRGAEIARTLIGAERRGEIAVVDVDKLGERDGILDRHAGALRQRLQGRMRGVAQQRDAALAPMPDRVAVGDRPAPVEVHHRQQRLHRRMRIPVGPVEFRPVARDVATLGIGRSPEHRNDVEQRTVAERIGDHVEAGTRPHHHLVGINARRHVGHRHDGAVGDKTDHARAFLTAHLLTDGRAKPVGADQRRAVDRAAILGVQPHAVAFVLEGLGAGQRHQFDVRLGFSQASSRIRCRSTRWIRM